MFRSQNCGAALKYLPNSAIRIHITVTHRHGVCGFIMRSSYLYNNSLSQASLSRKIGRQTFWQPNRLDQSHLTDDCRPCGFLDTHSILLGVAGTHPSNPAWNRTWETTYLLTIRIHFRTNAGALHDAMRCDRITCARSTKSGKSLNVFRYFPCSSRQWATRTETISLNYLPFTKKSRSRNRIWLSRPLNRRPGPGRKGIQLLFIALLKTPVDQRSFRARNGPMSAACAGCPANDNEQVMVFPKIRVWVERRSMTIKAQLH